MAAENNSPLKINPPLPKKGLVRLSLTTSHKWFLVIRLRICLIEVAAPMMQSKFYTLLGIFNNMSPLTQHEPTTQ